MTKTAVGVIIITALVAFAIIYLHKNISPTAKSSTTTVNTATKNNPSSQVKISSGEIPEIPFKLPQGFVAHIFASALGSARDLQFSPAGTLIVSSPNSGDVYALPDTDHNGIADRNVKIISGENRPHGLAFYGGKLFVAEVDSVVRYNWSESNLTATKDKTLFALPANNDHNISSGGTTSD